MFRKTRTNPLHSPALKASKKHSGKHAVVNCQFHKVQLYATNASKCISITSVNKEDCNNIHPIVVMV